MLMEYQGKVFMSKREVVVFSVISSYREGEYSRQQAALKLNVSEKTIQRLAKKVREDGVEGVKHQNCGAKAHNKLPDEIRLVMTELYKTKYSSFNFKHALEMIDMHHALKVSYTTFRVWCRKAGLGKTKKRRAKKARLIRERSANEGFMLQMDGSPHKWNGVDEWSLIVLIDDATSDVPHCEFAPSETTWACMNVLRKCIEKKGVPEFILTDGAGWSAGSAKRQHFSQFVRACEELNIKVLTTSSPEAKGRVERFNRTSQDRVIPELELYGIKGMLDSNRYLEQVYLPWFKENCSVLPSSQATRYRPVAAGLILEDIFCLKENRIVNRDHTISYCNDRYKVLPGPLSTLAGRQVTVNEYEDGSIKVFYGDIILKANKLKPRLKTKWFGQQNFA